MRSSKKWILLAKGRTFTKKRIAQAQGPNISDLPVELVEDVLSRLPLTSLRGVRSACKSWNTLFKNESFTKKHIAQVAREVLAVVVMEFQVYLIPLDPRKPSSSLNLLGQLISPDQLGMYMSEIYHCDVLILCITNDFTRCVVWNPYTCQIRWLEPPHTRHCSYNFAIGYQNKNCYKILRFVDDHRIDKYEIYDLNSDSWRVLDASPPHYEREFEFKDSVSLKGNTYWYARYENAFLVCFDFTRERFGPPLALPIRRKSHGNVTLSGVKDEQLACLFQSYDTLQLEIWVTAKIEPQVVFWSKLFLSVDMTLLTHSRSPFTGPSFLIDQETKIVVLFDKEEDVVFDKKKTCDDTHS